MEANQLVELVKRYQENRPFITNEEIAKVALVVPFIRLLGTDSRHNGKVRMREEWFFQ
jgi:predicted type IV restriction endonuclease